MLKGTAYTLASGLWSGISSITRSAAQHGLLKSTKLGPRVISVGNIQVGGAGKTPLVAQIAKEANSRGLKVGILSRGYKGAWEKTGGVLIPGDDQFTTSDSGDEPALLHELCPKAYIGIGANRLKQYRAILKKAQGKLDLIILDDGFQHWKIHKDLEIVALTSKEWKEGIFRDFPSALKNADLLVWTKGDSCPNSLGKPLVQIKYQLPAATQKSPLWLITGIADGNSAYTLALQAGYSIHQTEFCGDHERYTHASIESWMKRASQAGCRIALTGKDWVKWRDFKVSASEVVVLEPELVFQKGHEIWSRILWQE